jgi:hypothetical protein
MEVIECTISVGYSIYGAVTTSYNNTVAESECFTIVNCCLKGDIDDKIDLSETFTNNLLKVLIILKYISFVE